MKAPGAKISCAGSFSTSREASLPVLETRISSHSPSCTGDSLLQMPIVFYIFFSTFFMFYFTNKTVHCTLAILFYVSHFFIIILLGLYEWISSGRIGTSPWNLMRDSNLIYTNDGYNCIDFKLIIICVIALCPLDQIQ